MGMLLWAPDCSLDWDPDICDSAAAGGHFQMHQGGFERMAVLVLMPN